MNGKEKCRILKEIRRQIAAENDIELVIRECTHQGNCRGTCPRCESEVRYLEEQLNKRRKLGKAVAVTALSAGLIVASAGCTSSFFQPELGGEPAEADCVIAEPTPTALPEEELIVGEIAEEDTDVIEKAGDLVIEDEPSDDLAAEDELAGEPAWEPLPGEEE